MAAELNPQTSALDVLAVAAKKADSTRPLGVVLCAKALAWLKLGRPRTWSFALSMFIFAYASTGQVSTRNMALGMLVCALLIGTTNVFNAWTDRREDAINLPHRSRLIATLGHSTLEVSFLLGYVMVFIAALLVGPAYMVVVSLAILDSIFYSWGLRFKAHPLLSLSSFSCVVALSFISGWVVNEPITTISPLVILLTYFFFAYGTVKNFPDAPGDKAAGVKTIYTLFSERKAILVASALLFSPYLLLTVMLIARLLEPKYAVCYLFVPVLFLIIRKKLRDKNMVEREATHALGYFYQITFFLVTLTVYYPTPGTILAACAMFLLCVFSDYFQIDSRPYNLRPGFLFGLHGRAPVHKTVLPRPSSGADRD